MSAYRDDLQAIRDGLAGSAESVAVALLGEPNRSVSNRHTLRWGSKGAIKVEIAGPDRGIWVDYSTGGNKGRKYEGGDLLALIQRERGGDFSTALDWARQYLRMPEVQRRAQMPKPAAHVVVAPKASDADRIARARRLWAGSKPLAGTVGETYLATTRGIPALATGWPEAVRFHPLERALVVATTDAAGAVVAVQLVYLTPGALKIGAAEAKRRRLPEHAKQSHGPVTGAVVRLPGDPASDPDGLLLLAEGPETGISVWAATGIETWIALGSMAKVLPPDDRRIVVCADDDAASSQAGKALSKAVTAWAAEGIEVAVATPWAERRGDKSDFNDAIQAGGIEAVQARIVAAVTIEAEEAAPSRPHFARPWLDSNAAARRLRLVVTVFLNRLERRWQATDWIQAEAARIKPELQQDLRARLFDKLQLAGADSDDAEAKATQRAERAAVGVARGKARRQAVRLFGRRAVAGKIPALQIKGAAGLGKTTAILEEYLRRPSLWRRHIHFYVPELALADELNEKFEAMLAEAKRNGTLPISIDKHAPRAMVIRGRTSSGMCASERLQIIERANKQNIDSIFRSFCHTPASGNAPESYCPFWKTCSAGGYISQFSDKEPMLRFMTHARMTKGTPNELKLPSADLVIVDESALNSMVSSRIIEPAILGDLANYASEPGAEDRIQEAADIGQRLAVAMQANGDAITLLAAGGISAEMLRNAASAATLAADNARPALYASLGKVAVFERLDGHKPHQGRAIASMFRQLARDIEAGRLVSVGVEWDAANEVELEDGSRVLHPVIRYHSIQTALGIPGSAGLLLIDADANLGINRRLFGDHLRGVTIFAVRQAFVIQSSDYALAKSSLIFPNAQGKDEKLRNKIAEMVKREASGGKKVLVVMPLAVRRAFTGEKESRVSDYINWLGTELTHFGRLLGKDRWKNFDTVIVIGREEITTINAERVARALYADADGINLDLPGRYVAQQRQHDLRNGSAPAVAVRAHHDTRVQAVLEVMREGGIGQALDRLRLVHRQPDNPGRVVLVSNLPVPGLVVDELLPLDDLLAGGTVMERAMGRMTGGVLPLLPRWLHATMPDLFPTIRAARHDIGMNHKSRFGNIVSISQNGFLGIGEKGRPFNVLSTISADSSTISSEVGRLLGKPVRVVGSQEPAMPQEAPMPAPDAVPPLDAISVVVPGQIIEDPMPAFVQVAIAGGFEVHGVQPGVTLNAIVSFSDDPPFVTATHGPVNARLALVPPVPMPSAADRLAALAARLEVARPPAAWGDETDVVRLMAWRERMAKVRARQVLMPELVKVAGAR